MDYLNNILETYDNELLLKIINRFEILKNDMVKTFMLI